MKRTTRKQRQLLEILNTRAPTRPQSIYARHLASDLGVSKRTVTRMIKNLRLQGHRICSDHTGYWMAESDKQVEYQIKNLRANSRSMEEVSKCLEDTIQGGY